MRAALIKLFCPICGKDFVYQSPGVFYHHIEFGVICGKDCFKLAELKYARMILGKDDL